MKINVLIKDKINIKGPKATKMKKNGRKKPKHKDRQEEKRS